MHSLPLSGLRISDLGMFVAGPYAGQLLADMGAEVIKIEGPRHPDPLRGQEQEFSCTNLETRPEGVLFDEFNRNKMAICIDLTKPAGTALFGKLVSISDAVIENYSPRVIAKLGLDYKVLSQIKPDIILVSISGFGTEGPYRDFAAVGPALDAMSGLQHITGYPDGPPLKAGTQYSDQTAALHAVFALLIALRHRNRTGEGQHVIVPIRECVSQLIGETIVDYIMNNRPQGRIGNRDPLIAPQGCYRCKGDDSWVTIAITSDDDWGRFCQAIGDPPWSKDRRFANLLGRHRNHDELDKLIEAWTVERDKDDVMDTLQKAHIAAGAVLDPREVLTDRCLSGREYFQQAIRPDGTIGPYASLPWKLSGERHPVRTSAPHFEQHNDYVFRELLGLSVDEVAKLTDEGVISSASTAQD